MPVPKLTLADALEKLKALGKARITVSNGAATAALEGPLSLEQAGSDVVIGVGCACTVKLAKDRVRHVVLSEKSGAGHAQLFDGNYDKLVAFAFPEGLGGVNALIAQLDGNDFEIG